MNARRATWLLLAAAQASTGVYLIVYLYRWQWNRALICGVLFLATEVLVIARLILQRLRSIEERVAAADTAAGQRVQVHLLETRPEPVDRFAWLRESVTHTNVFLPVLLGAGVLASAVAWAVEGVARRTAQPAMERTLVGALRPLAFPTGGFLIAPPPPAPVERHRLRRVSVGIAALAVAAIVGVGIDVVADATQTRPERLIEGTTTVVDLQFRGERAVNDTERHATSLIAACTAEFSRQIPTLAVLVGNDASVRVLLDVDLGDHGATRLRGCLEDTTIDRVQAGVVDITRVLPPGGDD